MDARICFSYPVLPFLRSAEDEQDGEGDPKDGDKETAEDYPQGCQRAVGALTTGGIHAVDPELVGFTVVPRVEDQLGARADDAPGEAEGEFGGDGRQHPADGAKGDHGDEGGGEHQLDERAFGDCDPAQTVHIEIIAISAR